MTEDKPRVRELARLVARGLERTGQGPRAQVTVAELYQRLVPYEDVRPELGVATKAEYDLALLHLLGDEEWTEMEELALRQAVSDELGAPEPDIAFLEEFAASPLRMKLSELWDEVEPAEEPVAEPEVEAAADGGSGEDGGSVRQEDEDGDEEDEEEPESSGDTELDESDEGAAEAEGEPVAGDCWKCEETLPEREDLQYCPWCGADQTVRECPSCEALVQLDWRFCPACGTEAPG